MIRWLIAWVRCGVAIVYQAVVVVEANFNCIICHYIVSKIGELLVVMKNAALLLLSPQLVDRTVDVVAIRYFGHQWWVVIVKPTGSVWSATLQDMFVAGRARRRCEIHTRVFIIELFLQRHCNIHINSIFFSFILCTRRHHATPSSTLWRRTKKKLSSREFLTRKKCTSCRFFGLFFFCFTHRKLPDFFF